MVEAPNRAPGRLLRPLLIALLVAAGALATGLTATAQGYTGINLWLPEQSNSQAGGHPDIALHISYETSLQNLQKKPPGQPCNSCQDVRDVVTHMPKGFIGSPSLIPQCDLADFAFNSCPSDTQVGVFMLPLAAAFGGGGIYNGEPDPKALISPIYNLPPHPYEAALLGFVAPFIQFGGQLSLNARTESDYGLDAASYSTFHLVPVPSVDVYLWGVPASPAHDNARFPLPIPKICLGTPRDQTQNFGFGPCHPPVASSAPEAPFLSNPTSCGVSLFASLDVTYYDNTSLHALSPWPSTTGCDQLSFNPSISALPTTTMAETAAGMDVDLKAPQSLSPTVPSPSAIKATTVTLPPGFTLNANAADGKTACTDAQGAFGTRDAANCPEHSKIGTAQLDTTALPGPIDGGIYLGEPLSGNRYRVFLTASGFATNVKFAGDIRPDPGTGQLVIAFEDLPEAPFQRFNLHFFGSERGTLATPSQCGSYPVETEFVPWNTALPNQTSTSFFTIDSGPDGSPCPNGARPFGPTVKVGVDDNTAGAQTTLGFKLSRSDGNQNLVSNTIALPEGLLASLRGVAYCPEAAIAQLGHSHYSGLAETVSPTCPASSRVGAVTAGVGAGTRPLYTHGTAYLAGPYKGAPVSIVAVLPAVSGPYDLGNVMVRTAIYVDSVSTRATAVTDPFPQILEGIPLRVRSVQITLDRSGFMVNPTSCGPKKIVTSETGDEGGHVEIGSHFQVANCANRPFGPRLSLRLSGGLRRRGHPAIRAELRANPGESNIDRVAVELPKGQLLDNAHIGNVCTRVDFGREACPSGSNLGRAEVTSPLLDNPLRGEVYLRASSHKLPDLVIDLKGQVDVELAGRVDSVAGTLRTTFESLPDVPLTSFVLDLAGGSKGLLVNTEDLCGETKRAKVRMTAQSGVVARAKPKVVLANCNSLPKRKRHRKGARR